MARVITAQLMRTNEDRERRLAKEANDRAKDLKLERENIQSQIWELTEQLATTSDAQNGYIDSRERHERIAKKWSRRARRTEKHNERVKQRAQRKYRRNPSEGYYARYPELNYDATEGDAIFDRVFSSSHQNLRESEKLVGTP